MPLQLQKMKIDWRQSVVLTQPRQALLHHVCNIRMQDQATWEGNGNVSREDWCQPILSILLEASSVGKLIMQVSV